MTGRGQRFPFRVHQAALGEHVAAIWGWDDETQRRYHDHAFAPGPRYQGRGIGGGCSAG
ncbi:hypothetical protein [Amycolatopsis sp. VC5-11]|uniref:hypothetical protein n=1 Tax=Amycolatopsis sp. VC5-11 TaxID=3120156 RepID=UPI000AF8B2C2